MLGLLRKRLPRMTGHFRSNVWDPVLIISQIVSMQCQFYLILGIWNYFMNTFGNFDSSLDKVFTETDLDVLETSGRLNVIAFLLNSLTSALALWFIVQRTKLCLDFSVTAHLFHFLACVIYNGNVPSTLPWWIINVISIALMTVTGEFLCMRTEMKAIPLSMGPKADL
ncbi:protein SYS1 homolog [Ylistrum balloti]|uniref:protein SYS1 homolog n=1 Tax=Ylistrum balloti TaxID=509963 RepID=UPI002905974B|nr:protein SYS1 homolog [Ylistrum balloti]